MVNFYFIIMATSVCAMPHRSMRRRHTGGAVLVERTDKIEGHRFTDVAWLFANHQNRLPVKSVQSPEAQPEMTASPNRIPVLSNDLSKIISSPRRNHHVSKKIRNVGSFVEKKSRKQVATTDDEELMQELMANQLISAHATNTHRRFVSNRFRINSMRMNRRVIPSQVLRKFRHIMTNLPNLNAAESHDEGSGSLW